ncbi:DUF4347 domain-containing protein [Planctomycetes bacterium K23_9]|uniref:Calx-beta domain protein n=1 Tax=Stieleria marina TaxID=1930275 RepID=A0A517P1D7_9BACT|nr:Calx-beta domain protein [Planctomycetes bacterium K23_9]
MFGIQKSISRRSINSRSALWNLTSLEERIMLAGDVGAAVALPAEVGQPVHLNSAAVQPETPRSVVFVDPSVPDLETVANGIDPSADMILLDGATSGLDQISRVLSQHRDVASIHIIAHGASGSIQLGNQTVDEAALINHQSELRAWSSSLTENADILLYGCSTGEGEAGASFVRRLAAMTGADIAASTDATGSERLGADWDLEHSVGVIDAALALDSRAMQRFNGTLEISIRAAGVTNEEQMELQIDGVTVATYDNVGGDAYGGQFQTFTYNVDGVSADRVRIAFTNDLYDEAAGIDRNLRVDSIAIDGTTYQTESPDVFSTGTWLSGDGITPGFRESEFLHTDGYFQFAEDQSPDGSLIEIVASGATGDENLQLEIDGVVVQSWESIGTANAVLSYQATETVTADRVRISFDNDLYDPDNGIDRNLDVDRIVIDATVYETESPDVFSTSTWLPGDGITPGFRQSETLHANGYFQYASEPVSTNPGTIGLTLGELTIDESLGTLNFIVFREGGADGVVTVDYATSNGTAGNGDYENISGTLTFDDGVTGQQLSLQITDDDFYESDETFSLSISNPTGGALLGATTSQLVTITDNDDVFTGVIFEDSFEGSTNWTANPFGTDTATTGQWAAGSPESTTSGSTTLQLDSGLTGSRALVTGLAAGGSVGSYDVDSGLTSVLSPEIALPDGAEIELSFSYYLAYLNNASNDDFFHAAVIVDGNDIELYSDHAHDADQSAQWQDVTLDLSAYAGQTVQILFEAADEMGASLIEAAVDDVKIESLPALPGTISVATTGVNIDESNGTATVVVERTNGRVGTVSVDFATVDGSADASDYTATSGTLTFADGESQQTVTIEINDDATDEDLESFTLVISNPTNGAVLGSDTSAVVTIADNDSTVADYLPDMLPIASTLLQNLSIDTSEIPGRELLRFSTEVANGGDGPLEIWGGSVSGNSQQVFQRVYQADGGFRDQLAGEFVYHPGHGHIHFEGFATYDLILTDTSGNVVASGGKTSFCLINIRQPLPDATANAGQVHGRGGDSCGNVQGISTGYSDVYSASLDDQWIDVTDVADGQYYLEITTDPENNIQETDETNNTARVLITIGNGQVTGG